MAGNPTPSVVFPAKAIFVQYFRRKFNDLASIQSTTSIILLNTYTENGLRKNLVRHLNDEIDIYMVYSLIRLLDISHSK